MKRSKTTKVIASICLGLMLGVSLLAGCTLVTKDMAKYYNTVVASFSYEDGTKVDITKKELITAYNQYGYQYVQNYEMEAKDAYKETINRIIDSKLTVKESEKIAKQENDGEILTTKEKTYLWNKTFDAVRSNIISYYNDINGIKEDDSSSTDTSSTGSISQTIYTPTAEVVKKNGDYTIKLKKSSTDEITNYLKGCDDVDRNFESANDAGVLYDQIVVFVRGNAQYTQAYNKYIAQAKKSEEGMKLSTDNKSVMLREYERIYKILYESLMTTKYSEKNESDNASATINHVLETYENKVKKDYTKYEIENASGYDEAVLKDASTLNYFKTTGTEYFYVSHILAKFSTEQQDEYDLYKKCVEGKSTQYSPDNAQTKINELYNNLAFKVREYNDKTDKWEDTGKTKSVGAVLQEVQLKLATAGNDEYLKAEYFEEYIYKYNEDEGIQNAERNYVIGVDYTTPDTAKKTTYTAHSNMVEPFTNAAIALYNNGSGEIGNVSELVKSDYGIHIIVYEGKVENLFSGIDKNFKLQTSDIEALISNKARVKAGSKKTIFDEIFDEINQNRYSIYESMDLTRLKNEVDIEYYPDHYDDLYK